MGACAGGAASSVKLPASGPGNEFIRQFERNFCSETGPWVISLRGFLAATFLLASASAASAVCTATVDKTVKICSPANGATVTSPVTFSAGARDTSHPVTAMIMYIDSVKKAQSSNASLTAILSLAAGNTPS